MYMNINKTGKNNVFFNRGNKRGNGNGDSGSSGGKRMKHVFAHHVFVRVKHSGSPFASLHFIIFSIISYVRVKVKFYRRFCRKKKCFKKTLPPMQLSQKRKNRRNEKKRSASLYVFYNFFEFFYTYFRESRKINQKYHYSVIDKTQENAIMK